MKVLYNICDMLEDEIKKIGKQENITGSDLDELDKMIDIIKDIKTIEAMENVDFGRYSGDYGYAYEVDFPVHMYANANRGRDSMGRYTSQNANRSPMRTDYSRHDEKEHLIEELREKMLDARTEEDREVYRRAIESLNRS